VQRKIPDQNPICRLLVTQREMKFFMLQIFMSSKKIQEENRYVFLMDSYPNMLAEAELET